MLTAPRGKARHASPLHFVGNAGENLQARTYQMTGTVHQPPLP